MKKWITNLSLVLLMMSLFPSHSIASATLGKKIYKKKFHKKCGFSGAKFARNHTQSEWEAIYEMGNLPREAQAICPKLDLLTLESDIWDDIYQHVTKYAIDGVAPNGCND